MLQTESEARTGDTHLGLPIQRFLLSTLKSRGGLVSSSLINELENLSGKGRAHEALDAAAFGARVDRRGRKRRGRALAP
jgi:hypothetical protein